MSSKQIRSGAKAPGHRRHIVGRLMGYIKRGYKARFIIVLVCILVSAIANVAGCYLPRLYQAETFVAQRLLSMVQTPVEQLPRVDKTIADIEREQGVSYAPLQRQAVALAADSGVLLLTGCADPYSVKTLRSSMGAVFRMPVWCTDAAAMRQRLTAAGLPLYGAALRDDTEDVRALDLRRCAIAIGSEGRGLTEQVLAMCDKTVRIPMQAHCESLNAAMAAAVLLWEAYR